MNELVTSLNLLGWEHMALYSSVALGVLLLCLFVWLKRRSIKHNSPAQHHLGIMAKSVVEPTSVVPSEGGKTHLGLGPDDDGQDDAASSQARQYRDEQTITKHIKIAKLAEDQKALASLYLERARLDMSNGDVTAAGEQLRKSIMLATSHDFKMVHAAARLELADISEAEGDMTTACEHWQMARGLFHELDAQDDIKKTDTRMLSNGCPTDWVLNDF